MVTIPLQYIVITSGVPENNILGDGGGT